MRRLMQSLKPEWYEIPQPGKSQSQLKQLEIDPSKIINIDFDRDLGFHAREMIDPSKVKDNRKFEKN